MRDASDFRSAMRRGHKAGRSTVVVYLMRTLDSTCIVGFAVSKAVGGAVVRNRVRRRLRAIMAAKLPSMPAGAHVVVRALPAAAQVSYSELSADLESAFVTAVTKAAA